MWPPTSDSATTNSLFLEPTTNEHKSQEAFSTNTNFAAKNVSNTTNDAAVKKFQLPEHTNSVTILPSTILTTTNFKGVPVTNVVNIPTSSSNMLSAQNENTNLFYPKLSVPAATALPLFSLTAPLTKDLLADVLSRLNAFFILNENCNNNYSTLSPISYYTSNFISKLSKNSYWSDQIIHPIQLPLPLTTRCPHKESINAFMSCRNASRQRIEVEFAKRPNLNMTHKSLTSSSIDLKRSLKGSSEAIECLEQLLPHSQLQEVATATTVVVDLNTPAKQSDIVGDDHVNLIPPPKKKWIRHYLSEDAFSSNVVTTTLSSPNSNNNSNNNSFVLLPPTTAAKTVAEQTPQEQQQQQVKFATQDNPHKQQQPQQQINCKTKSTTTFTLIDNGNTSPNAACVSSAAATKQMLLNGGVRIASPAAVIGQNASPLNAAKVINISPTQQQQQMQQQQHAQTLLSTSYPLYTSSSNISSSSAHAMVTMQRHKKCTPLTPPPMPSRKFIETNTRIRSFSLSSHKFTAAAAAAAAGNAGSTQQQQMLLHNGSEDSHMSYVSGGSSNTSPPRHINGGSHYLQMMSSAGIAGSQAGAQPTSLIGGTGRRRTISSNSNGAGTREVHNKLEKNRRAHLKDCYEKLKYQLALPDEDRKKTSNLAILQEALKTVVALKRQERDLEAQVERQAKEKINAQKKIVSLKRELGPKFEQYFAGIMPDIELGSIPVERENLNDSGSLSSGRGSLLYSSSSSLSSGGSSNNTVSSPVGAGLQTTLPVVLSPVISQKISTNNSTVSPSCVTTTSTSSAITAPISPTMLHQLKSSSSSAMNNTGTTIVANVGVIGVVAHGTGGISVSPAGSPTTTTTNGIVNVTMPLSLTAKNISATSLTRGSPTPSTPSPSPSSSSGVSSSSSIISSSPPMNGVINGRNMAVNIPNGLKFQTTTTAVGSNALIGGTTVGTLSNGTTAATIIATAPGGNANAVVNSNNNAIPTVSPAVATNTIAAISSTYNNNSNSKSPQLQQQYSTVCGRKKGLSVPNGSSINRELQEGEQPAKVMKIYKNNKNSTTMDTAIDQPNKKISSINSPSPLLGPLQLSQVVGGGRLVVSPYIATALPINQPQCPQLQKCFVKGGSIANELGRLPGGAELNILPTYTTCGSTTSVTSDNTIQMNGSKVNCSYIDSVEQQANASDTTAAFFHSNGKLTFVNGDSNSNVQHIIGGKHSILLNGDRKEQHTPAATTFALSNANLLQLKSPTTATLHFGAKGGNLLPMVVATPNSKNMSSNSFAQLITSTNVGNQVAEVNETPQRINGRINRSVGGDGSEQTLPIISTQYLGSLKPIVVTVAAGATTTTSAEEANQQQQQLQTANFPTITQTLINAFPRTTSSASSLATSTISPTTVTTTTVKTVPPITSSSTKSSSAK